MPYNTTHDLLNILLASLLSPHHPIRTHGFSPSCDAQKQTRATKKVPMPIIFSQSLSPSLHKVKEEARLTDMPKITFVSSPLEPCRHSTIKKSIPAVNQQHGLAAMEPGTAYYSPHQQTAHPVAEAFEEEQGLELPSHSRGSDPSFSFPVNWRLAL